MGSQMRLIQLLVRKVPKAHISLTYDHRAYDGTPATHWMVGSVKVSSYKFSYGNMAKLPRYWLYPGVLVCALQINVFNDAYHCEARIVLVLW